MVKHNNIVCRSGHIQDVNDYGAENHKLLFII